MEIFAERLKELRTEKGLSIMKLSKMIGVSDASICHWENCQNIPNILELKKIAQFFGVTSDYMLGLDD